MNTESTYSRLATLNQRCGKVPAATDTGEYWEALDWQATYLQKVLTEVKEAITNRDLNKSFDYLLYLDTAVLNGLYLSNGDYHGAVDVILSNHRKCTDSRAWANRTVDFYNKQGIKTKRHLVVLPKGSVPRSPYYSVHRVSDGTVMELVHMLPTDLTPFTPKGGN
jgi:hypothetical protein